MKKNRMLYLNQNHIDILTKNVPCPVRLNLELTTECNLKCIMCRGSKTYKNSDANPKHLSLDEFLNFLRGVDLNRLKVLNLAGESEPLLNPNILEIIDVCRKLEIIIELITNGTFLTAEVSHRLMGCSSEIHISFGGATKNTFESIRQGADFDYICQNIQYLSMLKRSHNRNFPKIWINPILMKRNIHEVPDIIDLAAELACDGVAFSHLNIKDPDLTAESLFFHQEESNHYLNKAKEAASKNNISFVAPPLFSTHKRQYENNTATQAWKKCRFLWNHALVGIYRVIPCSTIEATDNYSMHLSNKPFMSIWNNNWYASMRYSLLTGNPPDVCTNCKDPSVKDVNHVGSYFSEPLLDSINVHATTSP